MRKIGFSGHEPKSGALSAGRRAWQSRLGPGLIAIALVMTAPASATPGGDLETLPIGDYLCELPGDVTGPAGLRVPAEDFTVVTASSYRAGGAMGSYLLAGTDLTMTGGPHRGKRYKRMSTGFVRLIDSEGKPGDLRCVRAKPNNS